jgi:hypothetical protein
VTDITRLLDSASSPLLVSPDARRKEPPVIRYAATGEPIDGSDRDRDKLKDWQSRM